jgi:hypothetical protein
LKDTLCVRVPSLTNATVPVADTVNSLGSNAKSTSETLTSASSSGSGLSVSSGSPVSSSTGGVVMGDENVSPGVTWAPPGPVVS